MSYAMAPALQTAVFQHLLADVPLIGLVGVNIFDSVPAGVVPSLYVSIGSEEVRDASDQTGAGASHEFTVSVVTDAAGFLGAKDVAAAISDALVNANLTLTRGRVVSLNFLRARAQRVRVDDVRRIDLRFRARLEDD
jgi:hypothetical protein